MVALPPRRGLGGLDLTGTNERLVGGVPFAVSLYASSRGEAYELVFATVPIEVWDKGPAAANRWIKEHLPKEPIRLR